MTTYRVLLDNQAVATAAVTLIFIRPAATRPLRIVRYGANFNGTATSTQIRYEFGTKASAYGTYTSKTPIVLDGSTGATAVTVGGTAGAAGTSGVYATSEGAGTFTPIMSGAFNCVGGGLDEFLGEYSEMVLPAGSTSGFVLRFPANPVMVANWNAFMDFREA